MSVHFLVHRWWLGILGEHGPRQSVVFNWVWAQSDQSFSARPLSPSDRIQPSEFVGRSMALRG